MNKKLLCTTIGFLTLFSLKAQLSGVYTVPGSYTSVAAAIADLNLSGVNGAVTVNISAGYTETVPVGGLTLTATGTLANPITFQKSGVGANPILSAYSGGNATPASVVQDGIWSLIGSDYITISNIDLLDPNISNNATMEYGYGLFKAGATDGCNNVTIRNCTVTLNRINNTTGAGPSCDGSRAINVVNSMISSQTSSVTVTAASGAHSDNKFYSNVLQNCNIGIVLIGMTDVSPFTNADSGNDIGGIAAVTSNTIINFGGGGTNPSMAIRTFEQQQLNIGFNRINNNNGAGVNHTGTLKGILVDAAGSANVAIRNNVVTLKFGGSTPTVTCIENLAGSGGITNTVEISSNQITQCTNSVTSSGAWYGIYNNGASAANLIVRNNSFSGNTTNAPGGPVYLITNTGSVTSVMTFSANALSFSYMGSFANTAAMYGIWNYGGSNTATLNISGNNFSSFTFPVVAGSGNMTFVQNWGSSQVLNITGNTFTGLNLNHTGSETLIGNSGYTQLMYSISNNSVLSNYSRSGASGNLTMLSSGGSAGPSCTGTISGNSFTGISNSGLTSGSFRGISSNENTSAPNVYPRKHIFNNIISNITYSSNSTVSHYGCVLNLLGDAGTGQPSEVYNNIFSNFTTAGDVIGFWILSQTGPTVAPVISNNTISAINTNTGNATGSDQWIRGMYVDVGPGGLHITGTKIYSLTARGNQSEVYGILFNGITTVTLSNNMIGNLYAPAGYGSSAVNGIKSASGSGTIHLIHNTIHLNASSTASIFRTANFVCSSFEKLFMKNNIFINNSTPGSSGGQCAIRREWGAISEYDLSSDNNIFYAGTCGQCVLMESGGTNYGNINQLKAALYPREMNSHQENTPFASIQGSNPLFLHINLSAFSQADNGGQAVGTYSNDIDNDIRQGYPGYLGGGFAPDIGADEYNGNLTPCNSGLSPFIAPTTPTYCAGSHVIMLSNVSNIGANRQFQWMMGITPTGPFVNALNGAGATNTSYISPPLPAGTYYFVLTNTCTTNSSTNTSGTASVLVVAAPAYTLSVSTTSLCSGQTLLLGASGSGANNFNWKGPQLLSFSNQNLTINNANLNHNGTYTFQATSSVQCSYEGTVSVQITPGVSTVAASPLTATVCAGGSSTISAIGGMVSIGYEIGTQTNTYPYTTYLSPYTTVRTGQRNQMIVLASELLSAGIAPNTSITSIQFPVNAKAQYWNLPTLNNQGNQSFAVRVGTTTLSSFSLNTPFQTGLTTVVSPANFRPQVGYNNTHYFSTPFFWNGTDNVIIETTFGNGSYLPYPEQGAVYQFYSTTADTMNIVYANDNMTAIQIAGNTNPNYRYMARPNFRLNVQMPGSYTWSPSGTLSSAFGSSVIATPVVSSSYTVSVSDNTCSSSASAAITLVQTPTLTASASPTAICNGQLVNLSASGATAFQWVGGSASANYLVAPTVSTTYTVVGTNAPCPPASRSVQVVVYPLPPLILQANPTAICKGQIATLTALGTGNFQWSTGSAAPTITVAPQSTTSYVMTLTSAQQCQSVQNIAVTVYNLPTLNLSPTAPVICDGESINFTVSGAVSYTWLPMAASGNSLALQSTQQFTVTGVNSNGCENTISGQLTLDPCTGIAKSSAGGTRIELFPNPNSGKFQLHIPGQINNVQILIVDAIGKQVLNRKITEQDTEIDLQQFANGIYFVFINQGNNTLVRERVIKQ